MDRFFDDFLMHLQKEDKENCIKFIKRKLDKKEIDIETAYKDIILPALRGMYCDVNDKNLCIWKEHVKNSILRTIIEMCYPYVIEERGSKNIQLNGRKVIVVCPPEEYDEITARVAADYFTLQGYDVTFVGGNTPQNEFLSAIRAIKPYAMVISVTNYYNLCSSKKIVKVIKEIEEIKICFEGLAFQNKTDEQVQNIIGTGKIIRDLDDIKQI